MITKSKKKCNLNSIRLIQFHFFLSSFDLINNNNQNRNDEIKSLKESKYDDHNANTLPYRQQFTSPLKPATNKAFFPH